MESPVIREGRVAPCPVHRDSEDHRAVLVKLREDLVVETHLIAAHRAPVGRIEGQDHRVPPELGQGDGLIRRALQPEVGGHLAGLEHPACDPRRGLTLVLGHAGYCPPPALGIWAFAAASMITAATALGCESIATWLAFSSVVVAFMRFAKKRSSSGAIAPSSLETMYQVGFVFQAT